MLMARLDDTFNLTTKLEGSAGTDNITAFNCPLVSSFVIFNCVRHRQRCPWNAPVKLTNLVVCLNMKFCATGRGWVNVGAGFCPLNSDAVHLRSVSRYKPVVHGPHCS